MSIEYYSVMVDKGYRRVEELVEELKKRGYEILAIPDESRPEMVPVGENADGKIYYAKGWRIPAENGHKPLMVWDDGIETIVM